MISTVKRAPVIVNPLYKHESDNRISLSGTWGFCLDPEERGISERWFACPELMHETITVPGSWQGQGFGNANGDSPWDGGLKVRAYQAAYTGSGWYVRHFTIPVAWRGKRIWLNFGGVHPSAEVWLNGTRLGDNHEPFVPFAFEATSVAVTTGDNYLVVRVHEQARLYGMAFNYQANWSGLYRDVELTATGDSYLDACCIRCDINGRTLNLAVRIGQGLKPPVPLRLEIAVGVANGPDAGRLEQHPSMTVDQNTATCAVHLDTIRLWSPDSPALYQVVALLKCGEEILDVFSDRTGFVQLSTRGKHFLINGEPYYMRGTGDFLSCPETGCPDTNRDRWRKKLKTLRDYGYNYVRCQSYVYGPEYFEVADEVGLIIQSEMGMLGAWGGHNVWHVYQWPQPTAEYRQLLKSQWDHTVKRDVNHPSAIMYCMSNEYGKNTPYPRTAWKCYEDTKAIKPNALITWTDGGHNDNLPEDFVNDEAAIDSVCAKPVIQHEFRWWSSLPDVRIMHKYAGAVRPYAAEVTMLAASRHGISHTLAEGAANSQKLMYIEAKGKMERCRRDYQTLAGICHFDAMDSNPSPQGIIDEFYDIKCTTAAAWLQTNGDTVILTSLGFDDRVLIGGGNFTCSLSVSDFSHPSLVQPQLTWRIDVESQCCRDGMLKYDHQPFCTCQAGQIHVVLPEVDHPVQAILQATLSENDRTFTNSWPLWIYPAAGKLPDNTRLYGEPKHTWVSTIRNHQSFGRDLPELPSAVIITEVLDDKLIDYISRGGHVVFAAGEGLIRPFAPLFGFTEGQYYFTPPANYPPYEDGHDGTIIKNHSMLDSIPHEGFADLNFYRLFSDAAPLDLEPLTLNAVDPVIRVMHKYPSGRSLGYLTECAYSQGVLIICTLNLDQKWPEASSLLASICNYASGRDCRPELVVDRGTLLAMAEMF